MYFNNNLVPLQIDIFRFSDIFPLSGQLKHNWINNQYYKILDNGKRYVSNCQLYK